MTREEIEQRMDKLASKYVEAHDRKSAGGGVRPWTRGA